MIIIRPGMLTNDGFLVTNVSKNGWCKGYYPKNVTSTCSQAEALTSCRAHWLVQTQPFKLVVGSIEI